MRKIYGTEVRFSFGLQGDAFLNGIERFSLECLLSGKYQLLSWLRTAVAETREQFGKREEGERLPLEAVVRELLNTKLDDKCLP
jgi:hypothetical protein